MQWTSEQTRAITEEGNRIVSAAAGAGKTAVLTERLCRLVEQGTPVESLLVLTFTRAAAAEMKGRMEKRLLSAAENTESEAERDRLYSAASAVSRSSISTIDAFSMRIVKRFGHLVSLPPTVSVGDDAAMADLHAEALEEALAALAKENSPALTLFYRAFGSEKSAVEAMDSLCSFLDSQPYPEEFLADAVRQYAGDSYRTGLLSGAVAESAKELRLYIDALDRERAGVGPEQGKVLATLDDELSRCRGAAIQEGYADYREALTGIEFQRLTFPKNFDPNDKQAIQDARDALKGCVKAQRETFARTEEEEKTALEKSGEVLTALETVTNAVRTCFANKKREKNVLDFSDVEHFALKILENESVAAEYREKYQYIAVDEYQDTNRLNEAIVSRIARADNRFLVGDVKQSIYGFRQAEPTLFLEKLASFHDENGARIDLNENFRSAKEVLFAVNETFESIMTRAAAGMDYDARARLVPGAKLPAGGAELDLIERNREETGDEAEEEIADAKDAEVEARLAAERIKRLIAEDTVFDAKTGKTRAFAYSDVAVLMRSMTDALAFTRSLAREGVPCYAEVAGGYFEAVEVAVLLSVLAAIENRRQDIPMLGTMLSPLFDFSPDELARLRGAHREGSFYESVLAAAETDGKVKEFLDCLDRWRKESLLVPVETLINEILIETGFLDIMGAMPGGSARRANIEALLERARAFEQNGARELNAFLSFMSSAKDNARLGSAQFVSENVVRVMSMHKSKGLEFPAVIVAGLGKRFNRDDAKKALVIHGAGGLGLRYIDSVSGCRVTTSAYRSLIRRIRLEQTAEEERILYVAMTRAKQRLILIGSAANAGALVDAADPNPTPAKVVDAANPLQWLLLSPRRYLKTTVHPREDYLSGAGNAQIAPLPAEEESKTRALREELNWVYPFEPVKPLPKKTSVSRVEGGELISLVSFEEPAFLNTGENRALSTGTAAHALLQRLPAKPMEEGEIRAAAEAQIASGFLDREAATRIRYDKISQVTKSNLFARMEKSPRVERELPFHERLPAGRFFAEAGDQSIFLQGVIDCCFLEDDAWVLIDYKTDFIKPGQDLSAAAARHALQLSLYAEALETLTKRPVKEQYVILLSVPAAVRVNG